MTETNTVAEIRSRFFPFHVDATEIVIRPVDEDEFRAIYQQAFRDVLPLVEPLVASLRSDEHHIHLDLLHNWHVETFVAFDGLRPVAWLVGTMRDAETFYLQQAGVIPEYRRGRWMKNSVAQLSCYVEALGYQRLTSHHFPNNREILIFLLKLGFVVEGMVLDERYGPKVTLVRHFRADRQAEFRERFRLPSYEVAQ